MAQVTGRSPAGTGAPAANGVAGPKTRKALEETQVSPPSEWKPKAQVRKSINPAEQKPKTLETTTQAIAGDLPYSRTDAPLAIRAGYVGPQQGKAQFRDITVVTPEGKTTTRTLLPALNAKNLWYDKQGNEYYLNTKQSNAAGKTEKLYVIANEQKATGDGDVVSTRLPRGSFVIPSLGKKPGERIAELRARGLEVTAVLGTGFIDAKRKQIVGYNYVNETRLRGENAPASAGKSLDGLGSGKIHAGYVVTRSGEMRLLDLGGQSLTQVRAELKKLEADPNTAAINLFTHVAAAQSTDLKGVLGATSQPTAYGKSRSLMVFDGKGDFVGHIQTPAVSLLDAVTIAKQVYGDRAAKVLNQDGDFYAQSWFADGRKPSTDRALHFDNAMLVVRPVDETSRSIDVKNPVERVVDNARYWFEENIADTVNDAVTWGKAKVSDRSGS
jgi:hypothetical protein